MLTLSRKVNQTIHLIGAGVVIKVVRATGGRVHLSIAAPDTIRVVRGEIWEPKEPPADQSAA